MKNSSRLVYDISGKGFTRFRGSLDVDNPRAELGSTLNPALRFFVFDAEPNMSRLLPPAEGTPLPGPAPATTVRAAVDHIFWSALGRAPSASERQVAEAAIADPARPGKASPDAVADLLWAVLMKPEFRDLLNCRLADERLTMTKESAHLPEATRRLHGLTAPNARRARVARAESLAQGRAPRPGATADAVSVWRPADC